MASSGLKSLNVRELRRPQSTAPFIGVACTVHVSVDVPLRVTLVTVGRPPAAVVTLGCAEDRLEPFPVSVEPITVN